MFKLMASAFLMSLLAFNTNAQSIPRLWKVTQTTDDGKPRQFHILAITHNGLDAEYDQYYEQTVVPVFKNATALFWEAAALNASTIPECPKPLAATRENARLIASARQLVVNESMAHYLRTVLPSDVNEEEREAIRMSQEIFAMHQAERLSEYGLLIGLQVQFQRSYASEADQSERMAIPYTLLQLRPGINRVSVDTVDEMIAAYCNLDTDRAREFSFQMKKWNATNGVQMGADKESGNRDFIASLKSNQ